jgi:hypothetical protein
LIIIFVFLSVEVYFASLFSSTVVLLSTDEAGILAFFVVATFEVEVA